MGDRERGTFYFITGGARSGKSHFAENLAAALGLPVGYIATAETLDEEMAARAKAHQKRRPPDWKTYEEPRAVGELLEKIGNQEGVVLIDCLTLLVSNLLFSGDPREDKASCQQRVLKEIERLADVASNCRSHVIIVSNEVGLGLVPPYPDGRLFRDVAGWANQLMAARADKAYFLVSGFALDLKALHQDVEKAAAFRQVCCHGSSAT